MASVQLSQRLRDDIIRAFKIELSKAYRKSYDIQESLDYVIQVLETSSDFLIDVIAMEKQYQQILPDLMVRYNLSNTGYYNSKIKENVIKPNDRIGMVCNPNRPIEQNLITLDAWSAPYDNDEYGGRDLEGKNYQENDIAVSIKDINYYYPINLGISYQRGWSNKVYAPHMSGDGVLLITDPELCQAFSPIGEIEDRIASETQTFTESLAKKNTLKQFLDDWPAGKSLVPEEDIQRMANVVKRTTSIKPVIETIPDELKDSMNEVLLGNKLLGDD